MFIENGGRFVINGKKNEKEEKNMYFFFRF